jgi:hypothetical protein
MQTQMFTCTFIPLCILGCFQRVVNIVHGIWRYGRNVEVWGSPLWWELGPGDRQWVSDRASGTGLIQATGEGGIIRRPWCHPHGTRFPGRELPTLVSVSLSQGLLRECQGHQCWLTPHTNAIDLYPSKQNYTHSATMEGVLLCRWVRVLLPEPHSRMNCRWHQRGP